VGSLLRAQYYAKQKEIQVKELSRQRTLLETRFNQLPSADVYIDLLLRLQHVYLEAAIEYIQDVYEQCHAMFKTLVSWENERILAITSSVEISVLQADKACKTMVAEWEELSFSVLSRLATEVSQITKRVSRAEGVTQGYVAAVTDSSATLRLNHVHLAVTEAEKYIQLMDHGFCLLVFSGTPELVRKVEKVECSVGHWQCELSKIASSFLSHQFEISRLSILDVEDTIQNEFLVPRQSARRRIDEIISGVDNIQQIYSQLQAKSNAVIDVRLHALCGELSNDPDLSRGTRLKLRELSRVMYVSRTYLMKALHDHRAAWRKRIMQSNPLREARLWEIRDLSKGYPTHKEERREVLFEAFALGPRHGGKLALDVAENVHTMASSLRSIYLPRYKRQPSRSPLQNIHWRQLDVIWPMEYLDALCWLLNNEVWYLQHTLRGYCGPLWEDIPIPKRRLLTQQVTEWSFNFQVHRNELRQELNQFYNLNWMRLRSESRLYTMGERAYLSGRFEPLNSMSRNKKSFLTWTMDFARICSEAWMAGFALHHPPEFWKRLYEKLEATRIADNDLGQGHLLAEYGSDSMHKKAIVAPPPPRTRSFKTTTRTQFVRAKDLAQPRKALGKGAAAPERHPPMMNTQYKGVFEQSEVLAGQNCQTTQATGRPWWLRSRGSEEAPRKTEKCTTSSRAVKPEPRNVSNPNKISQPWAMAQKIQEILGHSDDLDVHQPRLSQTPSQPSENADLDVSEPQPSAERKKLPKVITGRSHPSSSVEPNYHPPSSEPDRQSRKLPGQIRSQTLPGMGKSHLARKRRLAREQSKVTYAVSDPDRPPPGKPSDQSPPLQQPPNNLVEHNLPFMGVSSSAQRRRRIRERKSDIDKISSPSRPQNSAISEDTLPRQSLEHNLSPFGPIKVEGPPLSEPGDPLSSQSSPRGLHSRMPGRKNNEGRRRRAALIRSVFGRKYTTYARSYQTNVRYSSSVSNGSLPKQSFEHTISPVPLTKVHESDSLDQASMDEPVPESKINVDVSESATPKFWSHSSEQSPGGEKLIVHYCRTLQNTEEIAKHFLNSKVLGFDMEWKSSASAWDSIQNNVSVIQIANEARIAIFQIASFKPSRSLQDLVSPTLKRIIESPDITKVGVSIKADCTRLRKYLGIDAKATFELSHLFKLVKYGQDSPKLVNKRGVNLSEQMEEHFGLPLDKGEDVRCGDWARALSYRQVQCEYTNPSSPT
jgi:hypothetical protein